MSYLIVLPRHSAQVLEQGPLVREGVVKENVPAVLPVPQLSEKDVDAFHLLLIARDLSARKLGALENKVKREDRNLSVVQVGGQPGRAVRINHGFLRLEVGELAAKKVVPHQCRRVGSRVLAKLIFCFGKAKFVSAMSNLCFAALISYFSEASIAF